MKMFVCDRCGSNAESVEGEDFATDWDRVSISNQFHYDVCLACARLLFAFFEFRMRREKLYGERPENSHAQTVGGVAKEKQCTCGKFPHDGDCKALPPNYNYGMPL